MQWLASLPNISFVSFLPITAQGSHKKESTYPMAILSNNSDEMALELPQSYPGNDEPPPSPGAPSSTTSYSPSASPTTSAPRCIRGIRNQFESWPEFLNFFLSQTLNYDYPMSRHGPIVNAT
eukprot:448972_1